jgi:membrane-associated phospholipid phosphatase
MPHVAEDDLLSSPRRRGLRLLWPVGIALLGAAALPLDLPIARWFRAGRCPGELQRWFSLAETYAHGFGVICILLTIFVLDAGRRRLLPRVIATSLGAGLTANLLKMLLSRTRPNDFSLAGTVWETFGHWLPLTRVPSTEQSFPSAHMATAFGLTAALIWLYPRGRWLFPMFALLAGCQRLSSGSHFLSDVLWGAAAGCFCAALFLPGGLLAPWFDRLESRRAAIVRNPPNKTSTAAERSSAEQPATSNKALI